MENLFDETIAKIFPILQKIMGIQEQESFVEIDREECHMT